jgi:hypothetical protein
VGGCGVEACGLLLGTDSAIAPIAAALDPHSAGG